jgi:hypothetical protein
MADTKRCTRCKQTKPLSEFNRRRLSSDGRQYWCRACQNAGGDTDINMDALRAQARNSATRCHATASCQAPVVAEERCLDHLVADVRATRFELRETRRRHGELITATRCIRALLATDDDLTRVDVAARWQADLEAALQRLDDFDPQPARKAAA